MNRSSGRINLRSAGILVFGICLLLIIAATLSWYHTRRIEQDILQAVSRQLEAAGFSGYELIVRGRQVEFVGEVDAVVDRQAMTAIAASVENVESVIDNRIVTNYEDGRHFELHSYAGITTVEGELPSASDVDLVLNAIREQYGVEPLGTDLEVRQAMRRPPWLDNFKHILDVVSAASPLIIEYRDDTLYLSGGVASAETLDEIRKTLVQVVPHTLKTQLAFKLPESVRKSGIRIEYRNRKVLIEGVVASQDYLDQLVSALKLALATDEIDNRVEVDTHVEDSVVFEDVTRAVFPLAMANWFDIDIDDDEVMLKAGVRDEEEREILQQQMHEQFTYPVRVVNRISSEATTE
ncbi:MAG: hypothetical protein DHS20C01_22950 [marine bacterium B5-7]|nr:MAG: hypothetical protein DHS20C01_22950 [marine bacterium B5-7]